MSRFAPTPLRPTPSGLLVDLAASTPPKSRPLCPMWPIASMLGAPCWPLQRITSPVNESCPPSPKVPRVLVWLAAWCSGSCAGSLVVGPHLSADKRFPQCPCEGGESCGGDELAAPVRGVVHLDLLPGS